jgi:hypothetical protein
MDMTANDPQITALSQLGSEFARVARVDAQRPRRAWLRRRGAAVGVLALRLLPTGGYAVAQLTDRDGVRILTPVEAEQRLTLEQIEQMRQLRGPHDLEIYMRRNQLAQPNAFAPLSARPHTLGKTNCASLDGTGLDTVPARAMEALKARCVHLHQVARNQK